MPEEAIRTYRGEDEAALLALWNRVLWHDPISASTFRTRVLLDPNFAPAGLVVAERGDELAGFVLSIARQVPLFGQGLEAERGWITAFGIDEKWQRQGLGQHLFRAALDRMQAQGRSQVFISPYTPNYFTPGVDVEAYPDAVRFLEDGGWHVISRPISMQADLTGFHAPADLDRAEQRLAAGGIEVRPVRAEDLPALMAFTVQHFGWDWYRFAQEYLLELFGPGSDEICFLVAARGDEIVGYCQQRRERFGPFGVMPEVRNRGIGRVLLARCLADMRARGFHCAWFLWTGEDAARLYAMLGFRTVRRFAIFERGL